MPDLFGGTLPITPGAQVKEVERELALRERVYPQRIQAGQMSKAIAERQVATMQAVLATLRSMDAALAAAREAGRREGLEAAARETEGRAWTEWPGLDAGGPVALYFARRIRSLGPAKLEAST